jgi:hypothetical protein
LKSGETWPQVPPVGRWTGPQALPALCSQLFSMKCSAFHALNLDAIALAHRVGRVDILLDMWYYVTASVNHDALRKEWMKQ